MASTYLERTPASAGNRRTFTISVWVKRSQLSSSTTYRIFHALGNTNRDGLLFDNDNFRFFIDGGTYNFTTNALYRDTSAWYHIVVAVDTTQATSSNRVKIYVNGSQITSFSAEVYPTQNFDMNFNTNTVHRIGRDASSNTNYFDGSMASFYFIDGTALTPSSFGETDATTGIWKPKSYSGSYGTNGFFLKFENSGSLGTDSSGNGNNFTVNGTPTQTVDTPSNVFCTLNPLDKSQYGTAPTISNGNLTYTSSGAGAGNNSAVRSTLGFSTGKWYWEAKWIQNVTTWGIQNADATTRWNTDGYPFELAGYYGIDSGGSKSVNGTTTGSIFTALSANDIVMFAYDLTNGYFYCGKNGTWFTSGVPTSGSSGTGALGAITIGNTYVPIVSNGNYGASSITDFNFGNGRFGTTAISSPYSDGAGLGKFQYQPPTGYYALCTRNINVYG